MKNEIKNKIKYAFKDALKRVLAYLKEDSEFACAFLGYSLGLFVIFICLLCRCVVFK